jgi:hypothetical protein
LCHFLHLPFSNSETTVSIFPILMACMIEYLPALSHLVDHTSHMSCQFVLQACHDRKMRGCDLQTSSWELQQHSSRMKTRHLPCSMSDVALHHHVCLIKHSKRVSITKEEESSLCVRLSHVQHIFTFDHTPRFIDKIKIRGHLVVYPRSQYATHT